MVDSSGSAQPVTKKRDVMLAAARMIEMNFFMIVEVS